MPKDARPSDNPIRVMVYAVASCLVVYLVLIVAHAAFAQWNGRDSTQGRTSTSAGTGGWFRDATTAFSSQSGSANRDTCGCTNSAGRMSGPV